ncbi:MAG: leucine-rich repeat domain-containing protein [Saprospiraceae bacterium]|nr:leucine-rich repeat domain-containing protein [Candidatus Vicinibacter affinis]
MEVLSAFHCQLSVLPSSFASLRNLLELNLGNNDFEQFPEVICELRSLRKLWLNGNKLSSLPQSFANLRELRELNISNNRFKEFPQVVCELPNLESLIMWATN